MKLQDFRDIHAGENVLVVASGPSLLDIPVDLLRSMPSIGINFGPYYSEFLDGFIPTYWMCLDMNPTTLLGKLPREVVRFVPQRLEKRIRSKGLTQHNLVFFQINSMPRPDGFGYSTTTAAATQLMLYMGAKNVLVAGFDCTKGHKSNALPEPGKTGTPHFYDPDHGRQYHPGWDKNVGQISAWATEMGQHVWNISPFTMARLVPKSDYREWVDGAEAD